MDRNGRSAWHAGGTRAPSLVKRGGPRWRVGRRCAAGVVPQRATGDVFHETKAQVKRSYWSAGAAYGTEWHDRPRESTQGDGRAR
jgi:hypothetical protein